VGSGRSERRRFITGLRQLRTKRPDGTVRYSRHVTGRGTTRRHQRREDRGVTDIMVGFLSGSPTIVGPDPSLGDKSRAIEIREKSREAVIDASIAAGTQHSRAPSSKLPITPERRPASRHHHLQPRGGQRGCGAVQRFLATSNENVVARPAISARHHQHGGIWSRLNGARIELRRRCGRCPRHPPGASASPLLASLPRVRHVADGMAPACNARTHAQPPAMPPGSRVAARQIRTGGPQASLLWAEFASPCAIRAQAPARDDASRQDPSTL